MVLSYRTRLPILLVMFILSAATWACSRATLTGSPSSPAQPEGPILYRDDFAQPGAWQVYRDATLAAGVSSGRMMLHVGTPHQVGWSMLGGKAFGDFSLEIEVQPLGKADDSGYGLLFRALDRQNFYTFEINDTGWFQVRHFQAGAWANLVAWKADPAIHADRQSNQLRVDAQGRHLIFSVNGTPVANLDDPNLAQGEVGLLAGTYSDSSIDIAFDHLVIRQMVNQGSGRP